MKSRLFMPLFVSVFFACGCKIYPRCQCLQPDGLEGFLFQNVSVPERDFSTRISRFGQMLNEQYSKNHVRVHIDITFPHIRSCCFIDSVDTCESLRSNIYSELTSNLTNTNSYGYSFPWGAGINSQSFPPFYGNYVDGKSLVTILTGSVPWAVDYRADQIVFQIFPDELVIVEYEQKTSNTHHLWTVEGLMLYEHPEQQVFFKHSSNPKRIFVIAPPDIHKQAFARLKEWQNSGVDTAIMPDVFCMP